MSDKLVRYEFDPANPPPLTDAQREELARLAAMPDEDIDFSDIPRKTDWSNAVRFSERSKFYRPVKEQVTLRIDADILHWFRTRQDGARGYQTQINAALRQVIESKQRKTG